MTMPYYTGRRVSIVFGVPLDTWDPHEVITLRSLMFLVPSPFAFDMPHRWRYHMFIP